MSWQSMWQRHAGTSDETYTGIEVDPRWRDFGVFLADMGERPDGTTLDRIDGVRGYGPDNCRWATPTEQSRNRRSTKLEGHEPAQIRWMVSDCGYRPSDVARFFGLSQQHVYAIVRGKIWR